MMTLSTLANQFDAPQNRLYAIRDALLKRRVRVTDLISGNVSAHGLAFPPALFKKIISQIASRTKVYQPDPLGRLDARESIRKFYAKDGVSFSTDHLLLTPGTSLSYLYVFKVLANPGEEILVPTPSYPLFDSIADLAQVKLVPYRLRNGARWTIDFTDMESRITPRTKAVVLISPHNPTGAVAIWEEVKELAALAARRHLAIISDEVFSPFVYTGVPLARPAGTKAALVFTLNGFSKMLALPGLKLGWIAVSGDPTLVRRSVKALDMISDTFLPVSDVAQAAAGALLNESRAFQSAFVRELKARRDLAATILRAPAAEGGFLMCAPLPYDVDEDTFACRLLEKHHILVHPGYFYDLEGRHVVVSFANRRPALSRALKTLISCCS